LRRPPPLTEEQARTLMRPFMTESVRLDRIWPPRARARTLSQIGGHPNLPPQWKWPAVRLPGRTSASLDFLAQIALGELPAVAERELLPQTGMLYFFALSQSNDPLSEIGPRAWRVLYYRGDASRFEARTPPADAGWNLDDVFRVQTPAARYRDPDGPKGELFPRCPVQPSVVKMWDRPRFTGPDDPRLVPFEEILGVRSRAAQLVQDAYFAVRNQWQLLNPFEPSILKTLRRMEMRERQQRKFAKTSRGVELDAIEQLANSALTIIRKSEKKTRGDVDDYDYHEGELPTRAEDAILLLNEARNDWYENLVAFGEVLASSGREVADGLQEDYETWRLRASSLTGKLRRRERAAMLNPSLRKQVNDLLEQNRDLKLRAGGYGLSTNYKMAAQTSLATLLPDFPSLDEQNADEVAAADPRHDRQTGDLPHRMLGSGEGVQSDLEADEVLLLQLGSDWKGPRFMWWDAGIIRFSIARDDLAKRRFNRAVAVIEGH
jgi:uncharacterized protein YwqG